MKAMRKDEKHNESWIKNPPLRGCKEIIGTTYRITIKEVERI